MKLPNILRNIIPLQASTLDNFVRLATEGQIESVGLSIVSERRVIVSTYTQSGRRIVLRHDSGEFNLDRTFGVAKGIACFLRTRLPDVDVAIEGPDGKPVAV